MEPPIPTVVGDPKLVATRRRELVDAATQLFLERGFHKTSVRDVVAATGWQMGTLYLYIGRKEDILCLILTDIAEKLDRSLDVETAGLSPENALRALFESYMASIHELRREIRLIYRESASLLPNHLTALKDAELHQRDTFLGVITRGVDERAFSCSNPTLTAQTILMLGAMWPLKRWALADFLDAPSYTAHQLQLILRTLQP